MRFNFRYSLVLGAVVASLIGCSNSDKRDDDATDENSHSAKGEADDNNTQHSAKDAGTKDAGTKDAGAKPARDSGSAPTVPMDADQKADAGHADMPWASDGSTAAPVDAKISPDTSHQSSSTADFMPCPTNGDPCKILPLGDSITVGLEDPSGGGYRSELFKLAHADGKNITFIGSQHSGPSMVDGVPFPTNHEGYSGWTISQITGLIPDPALRDNPNIILLMAGTNDVVWAGADGAPMRLGTLIDKIADAAPNALLVVAQLTPLGDPDADGRAKTFNEAVPAIVDMRKAAGKHVLMVDMHSAVPASGIGTQFDTVHPNPDGYKAMAGVWYATIAPLLP